MWNIQDAKFRRWPVEACEGLDYQQTGLPKGGGPEKAAGSHHAHSPWEALPLHYSTIQNQF